ncbi:MAG: hypothetical protein JNM56_28660 [Planctomycetia bacterium]|nr:hypothetical protein [Planctomycetia bacterium]
MTQNRWWGLAAVGALAVVGMYTAMRCSAGVDACGNPVGCVAACCKTVAQPTPPAPPKQHFRFVLDNLSFRMGNEGECKIKRLEIEYKGDGIDAEVAKAALGAGETDVPPAPTGNELNEVVRLLEKLVEAQGRGAVVRPAGCLTLPSPVYLTQPPEREALPAPREKPTCAGDDGGSY